jgi:hypothetical protein
LCTLWLLNVDLDASLAARSTFGLARISAIGEENGGH